MTPKSRTFTSWVSRGAACASLALAVACGGITGVAAASGGGSGKASPLGTGGSAGASGLGGTAGTAGSSSTCTGDNQCPRGDVCGYGLGCNSRGQCVPDGPLCNSLRPACACDGTTVNLCDGPPRKPLQHYGACESSDAGAFFLCGALRCDPATQYCRIDVPGMPGAPTSYSCQAIPTACAQQSTCSCIVPMISGQCFGCAPTECVESGGGVTVTFGHP